MSFDKELERAVGEIEIPDALSPQNIEQMLRSANIVQLDPEDIPELLISDRLDRKKITMSRRSVLIRAVAAAAAFVALAGGFTALRDNNAHIDPIESEKNYKAVQEVQSYGELYDIYTGIHNNAQTGAANGDGVVIPTEPAVTSAADPEPVQTQAPVIDVPAPVTTVQAEEPEVIRSDFSDADIVKSNDDHIYYLCGDTIYAVDKSGMKTDSKTVSGISPFEMYISGDSLILIGKGTDSGMYRTSAEIYDISGGTPVLAHDYSLGGDYVSARSEGGIVFLVTNLSDSVFENGGPSLDSYVPSYYADGVRAFLSASDISVPTAANNTDYTIMTMINAESGRLSAKAVLGNADVYCSADTLYVTNAAAEDGTDVTYITSFSVYDGILEYKASAKLTGSLIGRSMAETEGLFRIALSTEGGTSIFSLDDDLNVVSSSENLLPEKEIGSVKFEDSVAVLNEKYGPESVLVVDLNKREAVEDTSFFTGSIVKLTDDLSISFTRNDNGLVLTAVGSTGEIQDSVTFEDASADSPALRDKNAVLTDTGRMLIGIPVENNGECRYYLFSYNGAFVQLGVVDSPDGVPFERAVIDGDRIIMIGNDGMVSVSLGDITGDLPGGFAGERIAFLP